MTCQLRFTDVERKSASAESPRFRYLAGALLTLLAALATAGQAGAISLASPGSVSARCTGDSLSIVGASSDATRLRVDHVDPPTRAVGDIGNRVHGALDSLLASVCPRCRSDESPALGPPGRRACDRRAHGRRRTRACTLGTRRPSAPALGRRRGRVALKRRLALLRAQRIPDLGLVPARTRRRSPARLDLTSAGRRCSCAIGKSPYSIHASIEVGAPAARSLRPHLRPRAS